MKDSAKVYHFVNKGRASRELSRSSGEEDSHIRRHVRRITNGQLRQQRQPAALLSSTSAERIAREGWMRQSSRSADALRDVNVGYIDNDESPSTGNEDTSICSPKKASTYVDVAPLRSSPAHVQLSRMKKKRRARVEKQDSPSPASDIAEAASTGSGHSQERRLSVPPPPSQSLGFDIFNVFPIELDAVDLALIQFFLAHSSEPPSDSRNKPTTLQVMISPDSLLESHAQCSMRSEATLASFMVFLASTRDRRKRKVCSPKSGRWMSKALTSVQRKLCVDSTTASDVILAMVNLTAAEAQRDNVAGVRVHLQSVRRAVLAAGRQAVPDVFQLHLLHTFDTRQACELLSAPILPLWLKPSRASPGMKAAFHEAFVALQRMGRGFLRLGTQQLSLAMLAIIEDMVECFKIHHGYLQQPGSNVEVVAWIQVQRVVSRHRLLALEGISLYEQAVRNTLLIWTLIYHGGRVNDFLLSMLVTHLKLSLAAREQWIWSLSYRDLTAWMLISGAVAEMISDTSNWFSREVRRLFLDCTDVDECYMDMTAIMDQFLYLDSIRVPSLRKLARQVVTASRPVTS